MFTTEFWRRNGPGLAAAAALSVFAYAVGERLPWMGGAACGIASGVILAGIRKMPARMKPGLSLAGRLVLQLAVVLLGAGLDLAAVWRTGAETLAVMPATIGAVFLVACFAGKRLGVAPNLRDLIASGTAICGGSAIAAVAPIIQSDDEEISYAVSVVFLFNLAAVFIFPFVGHLLKMPPELFGAWAGTAVNDTSSVMAAAYSYHPAAVDAAALVKMTRTTMIVPIALAFALAAAKRGGHGVFGGGKGAFSLVRVFPWFVLGFLAMSCLRSFGLMPDALAGQLRLAGKFLIVTALSAIGLNTDLRKILRAGCKPIILGIILWVTVAVLGLLLL